MYFLSSVTLWNLDPENNLWKLWSICCNRGKCNNKLHFNYWWILPGKLH